MTDPRPFATLPPTLAPLGYRNYALYWIGFATSRFGRSIEDVGVVWLTYELTGSPILLGLLGLARAVPSLVLGPFAGVLADRVDQRRLLLLTQTLGLLASAALGLLVASGRVELWHVYLQVAVQASIMAFDSAVREAMFPRLVPRSLIPASVTLSSVAGRSTRLIGPVVGGVAIATWGEALPFYLNVVTIIVVLPALLFMRGVAPTVARAGSTFRGELVEGLGYILRAPVLSGVLMLELVFNLFQLNPVIVTIIGREILDVGPEALGGLLAAPALGSIIAIAGLLTVGQARRQGRFFVLCSFPYAAGLIAFAMSDVYVVSLTILVGLGFLDNLEAVTRHSIMQLAAPGEMRGRVMGNMGTVTRGVSPLAETQSGILAGLVGGPLALVTGAAALAVAAAVTARRNPSLWRFSRDDEVSRVVE